MKHATAKAASSPVKKVSVICTLYNEAGSAKALMQSIVSQSRKPDEVVIVDGGSADNTVQEVKPFSKKLNLKTIISPGANIARGRNIAISKATGDFVATIDGGCTADRDWLKNLLARQAKSNADVVAGAYKPDARSLFEKTQGLLVVPDFSKLPDDWPPSSRSQLLRKAFWKKAGGYPEGLYTAEDTIFNYRLKAAGAKYSLARNAFVHWRMRPTWKKLWRQFYNYGKGDGMTRLPFKDRSNINVSRSLSVLIGIYGFAFFLLLSIFLGNFLASGLLAALFLAFLFSPSARVYSSLHSFQAVLIAAGLNLTRRLAYFAGFHAGLLAGKPRQGARF